MIQFSYRKPSPTPATNVAALIDAVPDHQTREVLRAFINHQDALLKKLIADQNRDAETQRILSPNGKPIVLSGTSASNTGIFAEGFYAGQSAISSPSTAPIRIDSSQEVITASAVSFAGDATIAFDADSAGSGIAGSAGASAGYLTVTHRGTSYKFQIYAVS